jgi:poly(3-hydroxybutyrate) depolymerase
VPTIVFHGERDTTVNPANGADVVAQAAGGRTLRREIESGEVPGGHTYTRIRYLDAAGSAVVEQWVVQGGGHAWFGGDPAGSFTDKQGPDATAEMLRFFLEHPLKPV